MVFVIVGEGEIVTDCRAVRETDVLGEIVIVVCDDREADGLEDIRVDDEEVNVGRALREGELETREDEEILTERVGEDDLRAVIEASADREGEGDIDTEPESADDSVAEFESL